MRIKLTQVEQVIIHQLPAMFKPPSMKPPLPHPRQGVAILLALALSPMQMATVWAGSTAIAQRPHQGIAFPTAQTVPKQFPKQYGKQYGRPRHPPQPATRGEDTPATLNQISQIEQEWTGQYAEQLGRILPSAQMGAADIARKLADLKQRTGQTPALLYAVSRPDHLETILVTPSGKILHQKITDADAATLTDTLQTLRLEVTDAVSPPAAYLPPAQQVYQWLIAPFATELDAQGIDTLLMCVGPGLRSIPFAVLHDGQQYLVEKYNFSLIPAFNLLATRYQPLQSAQVLAMGASEFSQLNDLPAVPLELGTIAQVLWPGKVLLNQEFTPSALVNQRQRQPFAIVHLATHAEFQPGTLDQSYIQFWDQRLGLNQIPTLNLGSPPVQLLVLSACRTALGDRQVELGFAGLAVEAGVESAIASLWYVSDVATLVLMRQFYQDLKQSPIKAEALRQAQVALLQGRTKLSTHDPIQQQLQTPLPPEVAAFANQPLTHPYYWAAFTVIGSPW
ncbi:CHAT domain-containing protein [Trichothermofontia sp.]